jgi:hypothetical protein
VETPDPPPRTSSAVPRINAAPFTAPIPASLPSPARLTPRIHVTDLLSELFAKDVLIVGEHDHRTTAGSKSDQHRSPVQAPRFGDTPATVEEKFSSIQVVLEAEQLAPSAQKAAREEEEASEGEEGLTIAETT